ncbi:MAG: hypothetical protein V3V08_23220 [Nannocystaceae bacterium]
MAAAAGDDSRVRIVLQMPEDDVESFAFALIYVIGLLSFHDGRPRSLPFFRSVLPFRSAPRETRDALEIEPDRNRKTRTRHEQDTAPITAMTPARNRRIHRTTSSPTSNTSAFSGAAFSRDAAALRATPPANPRAANPSDRL